MGVFWNIRKRTKNLRLLFIKVRINYELTPFILAWVGIINFLNIGAFQLDYGYKEDEINTEKL